MKDRNGKELKDGMHVIMLPHGAENCYVDDECINERAVVTNQECVECGEPCVCVRSFIPGHKIEWHYPPQSLRVVGSVRDE